MHHRHRSDRSSGRSTAAPAAIGEKRCLSLRFSQKPALRVHQLVEASAHGALRASIRRNPCTRRSPLDVPQRIRNAGHRCLPSVVCDRANDVAVKGLSMYASSGLSRSRDGFGLSRGSTKSELGADVLWTAGPQGTPLDRSRPRSRRELLGDEMQSMTDQEIALIRRHAETMACIVGGCTST